MTNTKKLQRLAWRMGWAALLGAMLFAPRAADASFLSWFFRLR